MAIASRMPVILALLLLVAPVLPTPAHAQDTSSALVRRRGEAFGEAMKAGDSASLQAFATDNLSSSFAKEGRTAAFAKTMEDNLSEIGSIVAYSVRVLPSGRVVFVYCKTKPGNWFNFQFRADPEDDYRLQLVFRAMAMEPMERPAMPLESPEAQAWLETFRKTIDRQNPFSGVIEVQRADKNVYRLVEGMANVATKTPVAPDTRFNMASGSKMFTAVAVLQLAQAGKLSLDDTLSMRLPEFPERDYARQVTVRQLLTHTAGAGDYWDDEYEKNWGSITETQQMLPYVLRHLGETPIGEYSYSNSGYILLGLVIEAASGQSYYDYVRDHIFLPAGMSATGYPLRSDSLKSDAVPYEPEIDGGATKVGTYVPAVLGVRGTSAGGASTTAGDLFRFADALRGGRLLDKASLVRLTQPASRSEVGGQVYGLGMMIDTDRGVFSYGHGGMARGTYFEFRIYPELETVLVVMSNYNTIGPVELASAIDELIRNGAAKPAGARP
jgi:D-alanyl-D-alanine carboxypeptidase